MFGMVSSIAPRAFPTLVVPRRSSRSISARSLGDDQSSTEANSYRKTPAPAAATGTAVTAETLSGYERSSWGNFFIEYEPQPPKRSEEWMRMRVDELKVDVCLLFKECTNDMIGTLTLVDAVQLLGIDHLFQGQIDIALRYIHERDFNSSSLYEVALRFRLLREHGLWVSPDVFHKFMDGCGSFREEITNEPKGLLGLYNAAFLSVHGEPELEEASSFARYHLESMRRKLKSPLAEQVDRALNIPLPRTYRRLETLHGFTEYKREEGHNPTLLELAKLEFTLLQHVHSKELKSLSRYLRPSLATKFF